MNADIVIIGGGMVGAATACALQHHYQNITLIDASPLDANEDHRLIALNHSSIAFLKNLRIWNAILPHATPIQRIHISHQGHFGAARLSASDVQLPYLGYVIPANYINEALYQQFNNVTLLRPAKLIHLQEEIDHVLLKIDLPRGNQELKSNLLIAADGTFSTVRQLANIPSQTTRYEQTALVTTTELHRCHQYTAYERFQKTGAIALLPLVGNKVATIWTDHRNNISALMELSDKDFLQTLQNQFGYRLGKLKGISQRFTYPLQMTQAHQKIKGNIILLGNAAHTLHPIAAQGFNLALLEVATLRDFLVKNDNPASSLSNLAKQQETFSTHLSHQLSSLFAYDFFPMNTLRKLGLMAFDMCQPLKKIFINQTLGRSRMLPNLMTDPS